MAFIIKDRVKENTTSTGTGAVSLGGAAATFDTFQSYMSNGDTTYYAIVHTASGTDEWEVGIGTWNTGNTLTRTTVLAGSNGTSAENFSAGTKDVFMTYPASKAVFMDSSGDVAFSGDIDVAGSAEIETHIDLKTTTSNKPSHSEGRIFYDAAFGALAVYNDESDITLQVGQEEYIRVKNDTGSTIANGTPVYLTGEDQSTPTIAVARADGTFAQSMAVGIATHDIEANSVGYITTRGLIADVDTSHLTVGEQVHVAVGASGGTQTAAPSYPYFATDVGICLISAASGGCIYVNVEHHSMETLRVTENAHFDSNVTIDGDLTVLGTQTIASSTNIALSGALQYLNSGDTIGAANTSFTGTGLDDATLVGHYEGTTSSKTFKVKITTAGTPDKFRWSTDNFATQSAEINIDGTEQSLEEGISVEFNATTGHTVGDIWSGSASPVNVDTGMVTNRNTGGSGVGYTHAGLYYDVSTNKWTFFDEYGPEPNGAIDTTDSTFELATVKAETFEGNLTGNVTGAVTGNVSGNVTGSLTGNVTGDVTGDVTGNADTATALETSRTISLTGDVTGSATFDGTANASITAVVQDDSHSHVISNVDGLQAALDDKADDTITITSGNGLTGGGDLSANRTLAVGAGSGISVTADSVAHADTSTQASVNNSGNTFIQDVTLDGFGHVTGLTSGSVSVGDATITIAAGGGLQTGGDFTTNQSSNETITLAHADTSSQASVNNSNGTVIQDITLDTYGHITGINSVNLDGRYYTETEADSRFVNVTGDTMTGDLTISSTSPEIKLVDTNSFTDANDRMIFRAGGNNLMWQWFDNSASSTTTLMTLNNVGQLTLGSNTVFHDGYHPNADKWTTARTLSLSGDASGSVSWDGSANATLSVTVANDSHTHDGRYYTESEVNTRMTYTLYSPQTLTSSNNLNSVSHRGWYGWGSSDPTNAPADYGMLIDGKDGSQPQQLVQTYGGASNKVSLYGRRKTSGTWDTAWTQYFSDHYHPNADKWTTARTLSLSGDASGSVSWDGSANATLSVTVANDSHNHNHSDGGFTVNGTVQATGGANIVSTSSNPFRWQRSALSQTGQDDNVTVHVDDSNIYFTHNNDADGDASGFRFRRMTGGSAQTLLSFDASQISYKGNSIWHAGNDGTGSGLDADLLDGVQGSSYLRSDATDTASNLTINTLTIGSSAKINFQNNDSISYDDGDGVGAFNFNADNSTANAKVKAGEVHAATNVYVGDQIIHTGDTDTYMQFHAANQWRVVTGGTERLEVNNDTMTVAATLSMNGHQLDMNNNDIVGVDQIVHEGDTNTYIQFHAADQFRVVTGGTERLEVNNSRTQIDNLLVTGFCKLDSNTPFYENEDVVASNYTITNGLNAMSAGPITVNSGITVTVNDGEAWTIV